MSSSATNKPGWLRKTVGILLALGTLGYAAYVTYQGGLINPDRPRNYRHVRQAMKLHALDSQEAEKLFKRATHVKPVDQKRIERSKRRIWEAIDGRIEFHKNLTSGKIQVPEKYSNQLARFQANDLKKIPPEYLIRVPDVTDQAIYFREARHYEIFGAAPGTAESVFKAYLAKLAEQKWLVSDLVFDEEQKSGIVCAGREKWHLMVAVAEKPLFPKQPVMVFWRMDRQDTYGDKEAFVFRRGLGGGFYDY
jgi:hypothetical protein